MSEFEEEIEAINYVRLVLEGAKEGEDRAFNVKISRAWAEEVYSNLNIKAANKRNQQNAQEVSGLSEDLLSVLRKKFKDSLTQTEFGGNDVSIDLSYREVDILGNWQLSANREAYSRQIKSPSHSGAITHKNLIDEGTRLFFELNENFIKAGGKDNVELRQEFEGLAKTEGVNR